MKAERKAILCIWLVSASILMDLMITLRLGIFVDMIIWHRFPLAWELMWSELTKPRKNAPNWTDRDQRGLITDDRQWPFAGSPFLGPDPKKRTQRSPPPERLLVGCIQVVGLLT